MLKAQTYLLVAILLLLLAGCESRSDSRLQPIFAQAEQLMEQHADSARSLLEKVHPQVDSAGRATQMRYYLLCTEADDKCMVVHTSDSLATLVAAYFSSHGTPMERMKAYYMLGRVHNDMQFTGDAIDDFKRVLEVKGAPNDTATYRLRARANNWIGQTLMYQDMYKEALPYFFKSYNDALLSGTESVIVYSLRDIGRNYIARNIVAEGIMYYKKAADYALKHNDTFMAKVVWAELANVYRENGDYVNTKLMLDKARGLDKEENLEPYDFIMANYYLDLNKPDSAISYFKRHLGFSHASTQARAQMLAQIYKQKGNLSLENFYQNMNVTYLDSIYADKQIQQENILRILGKKLQVEKAYNEIRHKDDLLFFGIAIAVVIALFAVILVFLYFRRMKRKNNAQQLRLKGMLEDLKETLSAKNDLITQMKEKNSDLQPVMQINDTDVYQRILDDKYIVRYADYLELGKALDSYCNRFSSRIKQLQPEMKDKEMSVCYLLKIGISKKKIALLLGYKQSALSMLCIRLYTKLTGEKGSNDDFDKFIRSF